jgi:hypothetical protein
MIVIASTEAKAQAWLDAHPEYVSARIVTSEHPEALADFRRAQFVVVDPMPWEPHVLEGFRMYNTEIDT